MKKLESFNSEDKNPYKNLVLHIQGGLGKVILATAVIKSYKMANPKAKVVVVSGYPEVFVNNPDVHRFFSFNTPYLWKDYYGNPEWNVYAEDPYFTQEWIKNTQIHLIDIWCEEIGVPSLQTTPLLYFSGPEIDELNAMIVVDKPLICVQSTGGSTPAARSWTRNPPNHELDGYLSQFLESHYIVHIGLPETPVLQNVHQRIENLNRRQAMCLMYYANMVVGIDSYAMHARAANLERGKSVFFFPISESVARLGYEGDNIENITPRQEVQDILKNHSDYFATVFKLNIENASENCPIPPTMKWFDFSSIE